MRLHTTGRLAALVLLLPLALAACDSAGPNSTDLSATATGASARGGQDRIGICHRTSSATNPWVLITVANPSVADAHLGNHDDYRADDPRSPLDMNCNPREVEGGGRITITLISANTDLKMSDLYLFAGDPNPGPSQMPLGGRFIFQNSAPVGTTVVVEGVAPGTPLHFGLLVNGLFNAATSPNGTRNAWFYTGPASENFDNAVHALFTPVSDTAASTVYDLGFEDLCLRSANTPAVCNGTYGSNIPVYADFDFNDIVFRVTIEG